MISRKVGLRNVGPPKSPHDPIDGEVGNTVLSPEPSHAYASGVVPRAYLLNLGLRQLGCRRVFSQGHSLGVFPSPMSVTTHDPLWMTTSTRRIALRLTFFRHLVRVVVGNSSRKQMCRVTARGVVAVMANVHPFWDRAVSQLVGQARGNHVLVDAYHKLPVPFSTTTRRPGPARLGAARHIDLLPKALRDGSRLVRHIARTRTELALLFAGIHSKARTTMLTGQCYRHRSPIGAICRY